MIQWTEGRNALRNEWVFTLKNEENNPNPRYKACIVLKGCNQKKGIDFEEIFSPVVKTWRLISNSQFRAILGLAAKQDLEVEQLDVKTPFLHGDLEEEIYMEQPKRFCRTRERTLSVPPEENLGSDKLVQ